MLRVLHVAEADIVTQQACLQGGFRQASAEEVNEMFQEAFAQAQGGAGMGGFASMFEQQRRMRGPDLRVQMRISLKEAAEGVSRTMQIPTRNVSGKRESRSVQIDIPPGESPPSDCVTHLQHTFRTPVTIQLCSENACKVCMHMLHSFVVIPVIAMMPFIVPVVVVAFIVTVCTAII